MKLSGEAVSALMLTVLFTNSEKIENPVVVEGLVQNFRFHPERIAAEKPQIDELLRQLPKEFYQKGGGRFLNLCIDKNDKQWTGLQQQMENLVCLGIAVGSAKWLMKEFAAAMPGGVPYVVILLDANVETA
jgi:hypothetical protein